MRRANAAQIALVALGDDNDAAVHDAAHALNVIGPGIDTPPDPALLMTHRNLFVRMLATVSRSPLPRRADSSLSRWQAMQTTECDPA
jgi:hypothetical protein